MKRTILAAMLAASSTLCFGQTFEVASIKPAAPQDPHRMMTGISGGPGTRDPGQFTATNASIRQLLTQAYDVKDFQIQGPGWLGSERFDIMAKVAQGATKEQFRVMLQNLLAERFKVSLHHETKELPTYALVVGKSGVKMKEAAPPPPATDADGPKEPGVSFSAGPKTTVGRDGVPRLAPGGRGGMMMSFGGGKAHLQGTGMPMAQLVNMLAQQLSRPVIDQTGLTANYDFELEFTPEGGPHGAMMMAGPGGAGGADASADGGPNLITAVQEQLGLKLEAKKGPVDMLVIDGAEKTPTEN